MKWPVGAQGYLAPALVCAVLLVFAPSLSSHYLNWDDPWLVQDNSVLREPLGSALRSILFDLDHSTRHILGAEYLPVRDLSHWMELNLFGWSGLGMRLTNVFLYTLGVLGCRVVLRTLAGPVGGELAAWLFALHPLHVESVAWIAGRKDVLALLFVVCALVLHVRNQVHQTRFWWAVPAALGLAHLSKAMTVAAVGLLVACDLLMKRKLHARTYATAAVVAIAALAVHVSVGETVGMFAKNEHALLDNILITGQVLATYLLRFFTPVNLSIVYDRVLPDTLLGSVCWLGIMVIVVLSWRAWSRSDRAPAAALAWFALPLLPVLPMLVSLQNKMADRYMLFSVLGPALLIGVLVNRLGTPSRLSMTLFACPLVLLAGLSAQRAHLFSNSELLFRDAVAKTSHTPAATYQLGMALEAKGQTEEARRLYEETVRRSESKEEYARRATTNLTKMAVYQGQLTEARRWAREGHESWPNDPVSLTNLAAIEDALGNRDEATRLFNDLAARFPDHVAQLQKRR